MNSSESFLAFPAIRQAQLIRRRVRIEQRPVPELAPGKVMLRVRRAGICGTDVHYFEEGRFGRFAVTAPFILGHEVTGEIVAVAEGVTQPVVGERVAVNPSRQCGQCDYCRAGRGNLCRRVVMLGSASTKPPTNGAFSEYLSLGAEQCFRLPPEVDDGLAAMMEPFAVALHAVRRAGVVAGKRVLVTGGGPIGLIVAMTAKAFGSAPVALSDPVPARRQMAQQVGADFVFDPTEETCVRQAIERTGDGFDMVFEASGAGPALRQAFELARRGGTIVQIGVMSAPEVSLPANQVMINELTLVGSFRYADVFEEGIRLLASGRVNLKPLISRVFPLAQINEAMALACARNDAVKVQLDFLKTHNAA